MNVRLLAVALVVAFTTSACAVLRVARTPMRVVEHQALEEGPERVLILLPGFGDRPKAFDRHGFIDALHAVDPTWQVIAVDAHFGYYRKNTVIDRLHADVLAPLDAADEVWVLGISMGGSGALGLAEEHGDLLDGVILLAPYTGGSDIVDEVRAAGGLESWEQHEVADEKPRPAYFRDLWAWMDGYTTEAERPPLYLGVGTADRFKRGADLIGDVLPDGHYRMLPGGHDWTVWTPLFEDFAADVLVR